MTGETIKAMAAAMANIGKELEALSKCIINSTQELIEDKSVQGDADKSVQEVDRKPVQEVDRKPVKPIKKKIEKKPAATKKRKAKSDKQKKLVKKTKEPTVLDRVYKVISRSRKGATVEKIKEATQLDKKQISNSLYKLTKKGMVKTVSRGIYVAADE
ncbi:MAG: hypothetical protein OMM_06329 [Candidatus Magnetoglobus multicellularis str. Araruama]|uniref:Replication protein A C-terminal domain-containing protein n=1 Tax=Candidatus Magnetoglobus multicellularis str. Araruama TaxID=890399 RepID=A0A1V1PI70_9BACT|nr:MAG: hypothetical protein OMM_06329 [Candidatus Magnetoglobus multicellularis str. Araruama]